MNSSNGEVHLSSIQESNIKLKYLKLKKGNSLMLTKSNASIQSFPSWFAILHVKGIFFFNKKQNFINHREDFFRRIRRKNAEKN